MKDLKKVKRGHLNTLRNHIDFLEKLYYTSENILRLQYENEILNKIVSGIKNSLGERVKELEAENEMLRDEIFKKSDIIYKLENKC